MTRRPFDPRELDEPLASGDLTISELERYAMTSDTDAPHGLSDRIMSAVEREPAPRRGLVAWLTSPGSGGGGGRFLRLGVVAATLVLAVAGALFAGQLADLVRDVGGPSQTPSVSPSPSSLPSTTPVPSLTEVPSPSATPEASDDQGGAISPTVQPTAPQTPNATPEETAEETQTPRPSPTVTASPSPTPTQTP